MNDSTHVTVDLHYTKNLGNYESLRVGIGVEDFVRTGETVEQATERVYEFVEGKLIQKVNEIAKELEGGGARR